MSEDKSIPPTSIATLPFAVANGLTSKDHQSLVLLGLLVGFFVILFGYQWYRQRSAPSDGPPDPSRHWLPLHDDKGRPLLSTFRYPLEAVRPLRWMPWLSVPIVLFLYFAAAVRPTGVTLVPMLVFGALSCACLYSLYLSSKTYSVDVQADSVVVKGMGFSHVYKFSELGKIALLEGGGRGSKYVLALYNSKGSMVCRLSSGLGGFEQLVALVKARAFEAGVPYRYRDMWGCWTK